MFHFASEPSKLWTSSDSLDIDFHCTTSRVCLASLRVHCYELCEEGMGCEEYHESVNVKNTQHTNVRERQDVGNTNKLREKTKFICGGSQPLTRLCGTRHVLRREAIQQPTTQRIMAASSNIVSFPQELRRCKRSHRPDKTRQDKTRQ